MLRRFIYSLSFIFVLATTLIAVGCSSSPQTIPTPTPTATPAQGIPHIEEFPVFTNVSPKGVLAISGEIVIWNDERHGDHQSGNSGIYGYNLSTHSGFTISNTSLALSAPAISGDVVVWADDRNQNTNQSDILNIYGYNLTTHTEFPICTKPGAQYSPAVSGNIVVWQEWKNNQYNIYGARLTFDNQ